MSSKHSEPSPESRIFTNGRVLTMDSGDSVAEAVAVRKDRIEAVGNNEEIEKFAISGSVVVDLEGRTLIPGFVDAHSHFPGSGITAVCVDLNSPPIGETTHIPQVVEALKRKAAETEKGKWIFGVGYDDTLLEEKRHPERSDLDGVSTDHPVFISHVSGHLGVANSLGLELAGIVADTPDPVGGVICRDETGRPTGVLEETAAQKAGNLARRFSNQEYLGVMQKAVQDYVGVGVTTAQSGMTPKPVIESLSMASAGGLIPLRLILWPDIRAADGIMDGTFEVESHSTNMFLIGAAKIIGDGSIQGYTGNLTRPYHVPFKGDPEYKGYPVTDRETMTALVKKYHRAGMQIAIHGNGDATIDDIIHSVSEAQKEHPRQDPRHIVIHSQMARDDQLDAMKKWGLTPSFFSAHTYYWGDRHWNIFMGPERARRMSPARSALDKGIRFTIHVDTPVTPMNPLLLVWTAVNRISTGGEVIGEEERISPLQAMRAVTIDAAWQIFQEDNRGSIEVGKFADLVVLSDDPLGGPMAIRDIEVLETIVGGKTVFKK
ncbi:MAG: amidohydrolase [Proteobacteria bacterium]|nr:amidohydrolase [Pseudomonadota bacterium]